LVEFQNLKNLELFIEGAYDQNLDYFWILDIAMASNHLEKLSVKVSHLTPFVLGCSLFFFGELFTLF